MKYMCECSAAKQVENLHYVKRNNDNNNNNNSRRPPNPFAQRFFFFEKPLAS